MNYAMLNTSGKFVQPIEKQKLRDRKEITECENLVDMCHCSMKIVLRAEF